MAMQVKQLPISTLSVGGTFLHQWKLLNDFLECNLKNASTSMGLTLGYRGVSNSFNHVFPLSIWNLTTKSA